MSAVTLRTNFASTYVKNNNKKEVLAALVCDSLPINRQHVAWRVKVQVYGNLFSVQFGFLGQ